MNKFLNIDLEKVEIIFAMLVFIESFYLGFMFYANPINDYSNVVFTISAFLLSGVYLWRKI